MDNEIKQQLIVKLKKAKEEVLSRRENDKKARRSARARCLKLRLQSVKKTDECIRGKRKSSTAVMTEHDFQQDGEPPQKAAKVMPQTGLDKKQDVEGSLPSSVFLSVCHYHHANYVHFMAIKCTADLIGYHCAITWFFRLQ